jgi:3-isopropylmalate/(R)-2-methylmalate dehydratase small subunit
MSQQKIINGYAAPLRIANFDTDQVMPKQFLRGIDKSGLKDGLFYDLRFDENGKPKPNFFLNQKIYDSTNILLTGPNYGCGSSREHAVWGMLQYGFKAVIASSFAEIFYSNAMGGGLLLVVLPQVQVEILMRAADDNLKPLPLEIDIEKGMVRSAYFEAPFTLSDRYRRMFLEGLDVIGLSLTFKEKIDEFREGHWKKNPWIKNISRITSERLKSNSQ